MAFVSKLRTARFMQKKTECFVGANVTEGQGAAEIDGTASGNFLIVNLPDNSLITNAYVWVKTVSDAATTAVLNLGTTESGTEIMSAGDLKALGESGTFTGTSDTGTGVPVYMEVQKTGAATDTAVYVVVIEYFEYTKNNGEYTSLEEQ